MRSIHPHGVIRALMRLVTLKFAIGAIALLSPLFAIQTLAAQTAPDSQPAHGFGRTYDAARETTVTGTVQQVMTQHVAGSPAGMHVLVAGSQGVVDAHLGPFLNEETKQALHVGTPVQIVGAMAQLGEKQYFLARQLSVGGRTVAIRNTRGFLFFPRTNQAGTDRTQAARRTTEHSDHLRGEDAGTSANPGTDGDAR